jgi:ABC-2 type transport system permease protein
MNTPTGATPATRPMYWSVRREMWENRSIYVAPLIVAVVMLFGFTVSTIGMPQRRRAVLLLDEAHQRAAISMPYNATAGFLMVTAFLIGVFYCLDALHGERRDRTILFWKSMPVSDRTTVLSKASIPFLILPLLTFVTIVITQLFILAITTFVLAIGGLNAPMIWTTFRFVPSPVVMLYATIVIALWHAPIYAWLLLVSGWARRAAFLWAVLPFLAVMFVEKIAFDSTHIASLLQYRFIGFLTEAFVVQPKGSPPVDPMHALTPLKFLTSPGLWLGLLFAAMFIAAAVRMRRYREPI